MLIVIGKNNIFFQKCLFLSLKRVKFCIISKDHLLTGLCPRKLRTDCTMVKDIIIDNKTVILAKEAIVV